MGDLNVRVDRDQATRGYRLRGELSETAIEATRGAILREVIERAAEILAQRFIDDYGADILKAIDPQAVANLAIADSGRAVRESLERSIPREVQHHHHVEREVYKVGLFGNVKRVR